MEDRLGETDLVSGTENQKERETGIETETEVLEGGDVLLVMEVGEEEEEEEEVVGVGGVGAAAAGIEQMGETGLQGGRRMEVITEEAAGKGTEIGTENGIGKETETGIGTGNEKETVTETGEGGKKGEAARIVNVGEEEVMILRGTEDAVREENEEEEMVGVERGDEKLLEKKGTDPGDLNGERESHDGTETIDWQN